MSLAVFKKFQNWILLIIVPILLCFIFIGTDERETLCPPPCGATLFSTYKDMKNCKGNLEYSSTICKARCLQDVESQWGCNRTDTDCIANWVKSGYKLPKNFWKDIFGRDMSPAKLKTNDANYAKQLKPSKDSIDKIKETVEEIDADDDQNQGSNITRNARDTSTPIVEEKIIQAFSKENMQKLYDIDTERKNSGACIVSGDNTVDSMDATSSDKDIQNKYNGIFNGLKSKCLYGMLLMTIFWIFEIIPLAVTSLIPLFLWPAMGVVAAKSVAKYYFTNTIALFFGGLVVAYAIEKVNLHRRIALCVLRLVGPKPVWVLLGFMCITSFISMWISNVATTAMVLPIGLAVLEQLKENLDKEAAEEGYVANAKSDDDETGEFLKTDPEQADDEVQQKFAPRFRGQLMLSKALMLAICYCASIGGTGMMTGTGPNVIFAGNLPQEAGVTFGSFAIFSFPLCWIMTFLCWGVLWFFFLRNGPEQDEKQLGTVTEIIEDQYKSLGKMSFGEKVVGVVSVMMALLWLTRKPSSSVKGWADIPGLDTVDYKGKRYITDSSVAILMAFLLFILPVEKPSWDANKPLPKAVLSFNDAASKVQWSVLFLLGGGFAMAAGIRQTGLAVWMGTKLGFLVGMNQVFVVIICCYIIVLMTQTCSNSATITIFLPVLQSLADALGINPLLLMVPCTIVDSYAFTLPVSTPPNAVVVAYGYLDMIDLIKPGSVLCVLGVPIVVVWTWICGSFAYPDMFVPCAEWWTEMAKSQAMVDMCPVV